MISALQIRELSPSAKRDRASQSAAARECCLEALRRVDEARGSGGSAANSRRFGITRRPSGQPRVHAVPPTRASASRGVHISLSHLPAAAAGLAVRGAR